MCLAFTSQRANHAENSPCRLVAGSAFRPLLDTSSAEGSPKSNSTQRTAAVAAYVRGKDIAKCMLDIAELSYQCRGDKEEKRSTDLGGMCISFTKASLSAH